MDALAEEDVPALPPVRAFDADLPRRAAAAKPLYSGKYGAKAMNSVAESTVSARKIEASAAAAPQVM